MIKPFRLLIGAAFTVLALGAAVSATASAAECTTSTGGACISILKVLTESTVILANTEAAPVLEAEGIGKVECEKGVAEPTLDETASEGLLILPFDITFSGACKLAGAENKECKVKEPILTANISGTVTSTLEGTTGDANFSPSEGTLFATVNISKCEHEANIVVKGTQLCSIPKIEEEVTLHTLECLAGDGMLKNGTKKAEFLAKFDLTLDPEDDWAVLFNLF